MSILVSIDCITYNHEKYIADAIESFLMQKTNFGFEILIHDDASTDNTASIIEEYVKKYPNLIKPIYQKENKYSKGIKRISYTFNNSRAKGKYIAICEGDDYWTDPYKLQKQVDYMENHPDCSLCFHAAEIVNVNKQKIKEVKPYNKDCISSTKDIILGGGKFMATNSILYKKEAMNNAPDFYFNSSVGDYPLQIISSTKSYAYYINNFMSSYRVGVEGSWTSRMSCGFNINEKKINILKKAVNMLDDVNEYTNYRFNLTIKERKFILRIKIIIFKCFPKLDFRS